MKKLIQLLVFAALVATFALPALAQTPATSTTAASGQEAQEAKLALYKKFTDNRTTNPAVAYEAGKEYLAKYEATDGAADQYIAYIKKWVGNYEKIARRTQLFQNLTDKKVNEAFILAKQVLADFPEDLAVFYELSRAGFTAAAGGNETNTADTTAYAKRAIQLIQAGKSFDPNKPFSQQEKDEKIGVLNFALGMFLRKVQPDKTVVYTNPGEAATYFINAAQLEGSVKKDPMTYVYLAEIYESTEYTKLAGQYSTSCKTDEQIASQECKDMSAKINQVVDHIIDALARAISYSNTHPNAASFATARTAWTESLTNYYKYRNNGSDTGVKELIASITTRPLPKPSEPVTPPLFTAPASTTPATGATGAAGTTTPATTGAAAATTTPKTTTPAATSTTTQAGTKTPATKTAGSKTTPKRAHR